MTITVKYIVDNNSWSDEQFEDQPERTFIITPDMLERMLNLEEDEFLAEVIDIKTQH
jgi:hypothetical protein